MEPLVIDSNALHVKEFRYWLRSYPGLKIIPSVAFIEVGLHSLNQDGVIEPFLASLRKMGLTFSRLDQTEALRAIRTGEMVGDFSVHSRDHMIDAHVSSPNHILVTYNKRDFTFLDPDQVKTPEEVMT